MKIATYNVNGVNGRLAVLLRWLAEARPDVVCLQELKAPDENFPVSAINDAGYGAIWHGQKSWNGVAILARNAEPIETRRGLPGDPDDTQSRYLEAAVSGILIGCLYPPNGNPAPGSKFDYKLRWFERLAAHAGELLAHEVPAALIGDFNVMPTERDVYKPKRWLDDALFRPEVRDAFQALVAQGWTDALRTLHPKRRHLHLLGLSAQCLRPQRRSAHRPSVAQPGACSAAGRRRRRSGGSWLGEGERPCAGLDRAR